MISALISLVIWLIVVGVIYWAVTTILALLPIPEPIKSVINVVMIVILVLIVVYALLSLIPMVSGAHLSFPR